MINITQWVKKVWQASQTYNTGTLGVDIAGDINSLQDSYINLQNAVIELQANYSSISSLQTRMTAAENNITSNSTNIASLQTLTNSLKNFGAAQTKTVALGTAYQAANPAKAAIVVVNITSSAALSLSGGTTCSADVVTGTASSVATTGGVVVGKYSNGLTGSLTATLNLQNIQVTPILIPLRIGEYFAIRQTAGTVSIVSAIEIPVG